MSLVYWDSIDFDWLQTPPLAQVGGHRKFLNRHESSTAIEHYYFDTIKVDFAHITLDLWETWTNDLQKQFDHDRVQTEISRWISRCKTIARQKNV